MRTATAALLALLVAAPLVAADRGPSTPEERDQAIKLTRILEHDPLHPKARDARAWLVTWVTVVPDITVGVCGYFIGGVQKVNKFPHDSEIVVQTMFGQLAYQLEHSAAKPYDEATFVAGVESALKAYESIVAKEPKSKVPFLDELIAKRDKGELAAFVHDNMDGCAKRLDGKPR
jgi:hypothetical protein